MDTFETSGPPVESFEHDKESPANKKSKINSENVFAAPCEVHERPKVSLIRDNILTYDRSTNTVAEKESKNGIATRFARTVVVGKIAILGGVAETSDTSGREELSKRSETGSEKSGVQPHRWRHMVNGRRNKERRGRSRCLG